VGIGVRSTVVAGGGQGSASVWAAVLLTEPIGPIALTIEDVHTTAGAPSE